MSPRKSGRGTEPPFTCSICRNRDANRQPDGALPQSRQSAPSDTAAPAILDCDGSSPVLKVKVTVVSPKYERTHQIASNRDIAARNIRPGTSIHLIIDRHYPPAIIATPPPAASTGELRSIQTH